MHFWSKFGNPDYDPWWLMAWTNSQAQTGVNFEFEVKYDLEGQGQSTPKTIEMSTKVFYTYGPFLVILAWTSNESSRGKTWWRTDGLRDGQMQATTILQGQNWPRVKIVWSCTWNGGVTREKVVNPLWWLLTPAKRPQGVKVWGNWYCRHCWHW